MNKFPKINTVFKRDEKTKKIILNSFSDPVFELLQDIRWIGTEKINGTNIRIHWDGKEVSFGGRDDESQISANLINFLIKKYTNSKLLEIFGNRGSVTLHGEGYGKNIGPDGNKYNSENTDFILFDIFAGGMWFTRDTVIKYAEKLNTKVVPIVITETLNNCIELVEFGFRSTLMDNSLMDNFAEGLVLVPEITLLDRKGERIITKLKRKDFDDLKKG